MGLIKRLFKLLRTLIMAPGTHAIVGPVGSVEWHVPANAIPLGEARHIPDVNQES